MLFYSKMHWALKGMNFDQLWELEGKEARAAVKSIKEGIVSHLYKVCAEQYVISIGGAPTVEDFDRYAMGILPMREHLTFEQVWPLEEGFTINVFPYLQERDKTMAESPRLLHFVQMAWEQDKRVLDDKWGEIKSTLPQCDTCKVLGVYRVAGQQRLVSIIDVASAGDITAYANMPLFSRPTVEKVWALRDYIGFAKDVWNKYQFGSS